MENTSFIQGYETIEYMLELKRNEPEYLAFRVAGKFAVPEAMEELQKELLSAKLSKEKYESLYYQYLAGTNAEQIYQLLLNENNWYLDFNWLHQDEE